MKRFFSLFLVFILVFVVSACGKEHATSEGDITQTESKDASSSDTTNENQSDIEITTSSTNSLTTDTKQSKPATSTPTTSTSKPDESSKLVHTHSFTAATCTAPKQCSCGVVESEALGHSYVNANCTSPKICTRCGDTNGSALGHSWKSATCTSSKKCTRCSVTSGSAIGHNYESGICKICEATDPNYIQYTVVYNANGGWGETENSSHIYNEARALSKNGFKRAGYTFVGWSTDANAKSPKYTNVQSVKNLSKTSDGTIILYAIWKESKTAKFDECQRAIQGKKEVEYHAMATDNFGVSHNDVAIFVNRDSYPAVKRYDERYTNGLFSKIKGTLYLSNQYTIDSYTKIQLIIKADGAVVYKSNFFTKYSGAQSFEVDISGTNIIEIYVADPISAHIEAWNKGGDIIIENLILIR